MRFAVARLFCRLAVLCLQGPEVLIADPGGRFWKDDVIYFMITDRFHDGDPSNNVPIGSDPGLYDADQEDVNLYHGGDFRGIELALREGYFRDLGITAIWITPPVRNAWFSLHDLGGSKTGYHGYWAQDFLDVDPHLTSATDLDGSPYPEGRDGRLAHYRDLVKLAHAHGVKVVQDIVCNHIGPIFYYDRDGNRQHEGRKEEWLPEFVRDGSYLATATWAENPEWNAVRLSGPVGGDSVLGQRLATTGVLQQFEAYWGKGFSMESLGQRNGDEMLCDFFALRAIRTDPDNPLFEALVDEFVEIYRFYIEEIGVDGLRIDTVKHVHKPFWDAFTARLRERLGPEADELLLFGEVYANTVEDLNSYSLAEDGVSRGIDSLLNFVFTYAVRDEFRNGGEATGDRFFEYVRSMNEGIRDNGSYRAEDLRRNAVNFIGNHDGINRFLVRGVAEEDHFLALGLLLTSEGIPCLYYGSELALRDDAVGAGKDSETGRRTLFDKRGERIFADRSKSDHFQRVAELIALRRSTPTLVDGAMLPVDLANDDVFAFLRGTGPEAALVICNPGDGSEEIDFSRTFRGPALWQLLYENGTFDRKSRSRIKIPAKTLQVWRRVP